MDKGRKERYKNANNFARVGIFSALVVTVVLILKIGGYPPSLQDPHHSIFPGSAWVLSCLGVGPAWLL